MCGPISLPIAAVTIAAATGTTKAYGQYQEGQATAKMNEYQGALARQRSILTQQYAEQQKRAEEEAAEFNVTGVQSVAAEESKRLSRDVAALTGAQRATLGALGVSGVTAEDITGSTFDRAKLDQIAIRYNANLKSWQIREAAKRNIWEIGEETKQSTWALGSESQQYSVAARQARRAAAIKVTGTLLGTAVSMATAGAGMKVPKLTF